MSTVRSGLKYSVEHEWINDESPAVVGVSEVAVDALGEVVYVELPEVGATVTAGEVCGEIESTKSTSELYSPATGEVIEVNDAAVADPAMINAEPYGTGWLFKVAVTELGPLQTPEEYAAANDAEVS
ncbi:glycine cleavage system protein GcvH [Leucobacter viscericola]|uniref:Glycine cleavage system H protein n=1 Tax=Leucobacter viscericola TaxID=2714935 RepID=A0A6G7XE48_9MICO|nr:glycine cleavage system protein GcvH [Leucobacter viscericola]QIK62746.1 glycine cleavage system protein GcvH [Leucobacter viscericola]